ncbi:MAG: hypothetical protein B9S34_13705 [Opitutia bacterium Tous-C1TDCM]|nr:MAG: hypothetical protein B9S34_13705 [Opitutae bacterium Tous-C1TDCM]
MNRRPAPAYPGFRFAIAVAAVLAAACAGRAADVPVFAPHPTMLVAEWKKERVPVVGAVSTDPVVRRQGKEERLRHDPVYFAERAPRYGAGRVMIDRVTFANLRMQYNADGSVLPDPNAASVGGTGFFEARLQPDRDLRGAFMVLVVFNAGILSDFSANPESEILLQALPPLPAGVATKVEFQTKSPVRRNVFSIFPLVFEAGGAEIRSNLSVPAARYFAAVERAQLAVVLAAYRKQNPAADAGVQPVLRIQPLLADPAALAGRTVTATVTINADGATEDIALPEDLAPADAAALRAALAGWLFLPRLEKGTPVPTRLAIPFKF